MPKLVKGYFTNAAGDTSEQEMYQGDLNEACEKFPKEWSKTPPKASAPKKVAKKGS